MQISEQGDSLEQFEQSETTSTSTHVATGQRTEREARKAETTCASESSPQKRQLNSRVRKDKQHLHAMRHAVLSQFPLQALACLGENTRRLRRMEHALRFELKPTGLLADMLFDRMWSSYLRCLLAARAEGLVVSSTKQSPDFSAVMLGNDESVFGNSDLFRQLLLVQRYDSHFSREMFRSLGLLILLRNRGETGLEECIEKMLGLKRDQ